MGRSASNHLNWVSYKATLEQPQGPNESTLVPLRRRSPPHLRNPRRRLSPSMWPPASPRSPMWISDSAPPSSTKGQLVND
ncbi:hypothetical protein AKJ16_DCAP02483 [Drosera capensis]